MLFPPVKILYILSIENTRGIVVFLVHRNNYLPYPLVRHRFTRVDRPSRVFFRVEAARKISDICQAYIKSNKTTMERGKDVELLLFDKKFVFVLRHATVFFLN